MPEQHPPASGAPEKKLRRAHDAMKPLEKQTSLIVLLAFFFGAMTGYFFANERCFEVSRQLVKVISTIAESQRQDMRSSYERRISEIQQQAATIASSAPEVASSTAGTVPVLQ